MTSIWPQLACGVCQTQIPLPSSFIDYCSRNFAHNDIRRPFEVRYNPYTQAVEVLDRPQTIGKAQEDIKEQITILNNAFSKYAKV